MTSSLQTNIDRLKSQIRLAYLCALCKLGTKPITLLTKRHANPAGKEIYYTGIISEDRHSKIGELIQVSGMSALGILASCDKAFGEYLEVLACQDISLPIEHTRSGWATAHSIAIAEERADLELLERDSFLMHFFCPELQSKPIPLPMTLSGFILVRLQCMDPSVTVILAGQQEEILRNGRSGWFLGMGASRTTETAIEKAILECIMLKNEWCPPSTTDSATKPRQAVLNFHWEASCSDETKRRLNLIFSGGDNVFCDSSHTDLQSTVTSYQKYFSNKHVVIQRTNPQLIPLTFGQTWNNSQCYVFDLLQERGLPHLTWRPHPLL